MKRDFILFFSEGIVFLFIKKNSIFWFLTKEKEEKWNFVGQIYQNYGSGSYYHILMFTSHQMVITFLLWQPVGLGKIAKLINEGKIDSSELITMKTLKVPNLLSLNPLIPGTRVLTLSNLFVNPLVICFCRRQVQ